jgi:hypothetical protein
MKFVAEQQPIPAAAPKNAEETSPLPPSLSERDIRDTVERAESSEELLVSVPVTGYHKLDKLDAAGATASLLCAVHCALMPLLVSVLPLIGLSFLVDERTEWALVALSAVLGISSLSLGYREHRSPRALIILGIGLVLLATGRILEERGVEVGGVAVVVLGGLTLAAAHIVNRRLCHTCEQCEEDGHFCEHDAENRRQ